MSATYRRRPDQVSAEQWVPWKNLPGVEVMTVSVVRTATGPRVLEYGDWIVRLEDGSIQVLSDEEFRRRFEYLPP